MPKSVFHRASCSKSGTFLQIHLWIFSVFTPSSPKWSVQMCQGSRTEAAISVHTSAALMMMPLDLLCSAIWALDPIWLQKGGIPRHAFLVRLRLHSRNFMYSSTCSAWFFVSLPALITPLVKWRESMKTLWKPLQDFRQEHFYFLTALYKNATSTSGWASFRLGDGCW